MKIEVVITDKCLIFNVNLAFSNNDFNTFGMYSESHFPAVFLT